MRKSSSKPRVLVITERYYPENFLINDLVQAWVADGVDVTVLTQIPSYPADRLYTGYPNKSCARLERGVRVFRFPAVLGYKSSIVKKVIGYLLFMVRACWYGIRLMPGIQAVFVYHTGPLTQAMPLLFARKVFRKKTVIWTQDVWPDTVFSFGFPSQGAFAVLLKAFVRIIYSNCDSVCVSSPGFIGRLAPYLGRKTEACFIPQWVPAEFMANEKAPYTFDTPATKFIFTGSIGSMQNLEKVVMAFAGIAPDAARLYLLGDGSRKAALQDLVAARGINNVIFLEPVAQAQVLDCIRQCDFSLLSLVDDPLINLTIPAKFQTYLAAGKPIFAICNGEVQALVDTYRLGLSSAPDAVNTIVAGIKACLAFSAEDRTACESRMTGMLRSTFDRAAVQQRLSAQLFGIQA